MEYYYFNPFNKQYYFPKGFQENKLFKSFYQPYTLAGSLLWFCWCNSIIFRSLFREKEPEKFLPIEVAKNHSSANSILAFNRGTVGAEQKTTILGFDQLTNISFFMKYASSNIAQNINNEGIVLEQLRNLSFVPQLQLHTTNVNYSLIKTEVLSGNRLSSPKANEIIIQLLIDIATLEINNVNHYPSTFKTFFAHGDFCPWNIMYEDGNYKVFDWELAGYYPLGYDLFTFMFQSSFLLSPQKAVFTILKQNNDLIKFYFDSFKIVNWKPYLLEFASLKLTLETNKKNQVLINHYNRLKYYGEQL
jgi:hypothetical protein